MNDTLAVALVRAQAEMPAVDKTGKSNFGAHATLDHIIAKTRGVLNKHGLSIVQFPVVTELGGPGLQTTITHTSGESASSVMPLFLVKQDMQSLGSAITYARRYAWAAALGISAEADDDGEHATRPNQGSDGAANGSEQPAPGVPPAAPAPSDNFTPPPPKPAPDDGGEPSEVVLTFGAHKGKKLGDLLAGSQKERGYVDWLAGKFDPQTQDARRVKGAALTLVGGPPLALDTEGIPF